MTLQSIDIVIPVYSKKKNQVEQLLESLLQQDFSDIKKVNIFIVLNPVEPQEHNRWLQRWSHLASLPLWTISVLFSEMAGVNNARQLGLNAGASDVVFFFDDDIVVNENDILDNHIKYHQQHQALFACGGFYKSIANSNSFSKLYLLRQQQWLNESYLDPSKTSVGYLLGGHFSIKRSLLNKAGLAFDTTIVFGSSETEFFLSARRKGLTLNLQKWSVCHVLIDSPFRLLQKTYLQGRGKKYIEKKGLSFRPVYRSTLAFENKVESLIAFFYDFSFNWGYFSLDGQYSEFFKIYFRKFQLNLNYRIQKIINSLRKGL